MIAVDTNVLVHAHREDSQHHDAARRAMTQLVLADRPWAVPWPCVHEFIATVTHPRIFSTPSRMGDALTAVNDLMALPHCRPISEASHHAEPLADLLRDAGVVGPKVHDARIAAICLNNGVTELWTADRDFSYFPALRTHNPLVG